VLMIYATVAVSFLAVASGASGHSDAGIGSSCRDIKSAYQSESCCGESLDKVTGYDIASVAPDAFTKSGTNVCDGKKPIAGFENAPCAVDGIVMALEQAGANVTKGYQGQIDASTRTPITEPYWKAGLCPVNVHWHLGAEHYSAGQYDEHGNGPHDPAGHTDADDNKFSRRRRLASGTVREGFQCRHYDSADTKFTTPYEFKYCTNMLVGQTYEIHWPHSAAGACGTPDQYQTPFYDGVFCTDGIISLAPLNTYQKIGVQSQVFTIVNDEHYYYPDLIRGMIVDGAYGADIAKYTGSTTGTSRDNEVCSVYTPITWQVDRTCHLISASSFDKMCKDMLNGPRDDLSGDTHPHGARTLVADHLAANNHHRK